MGDLVKPKQIKILTTNSTEDIVDKEFERNLYWSQKIRNNTQPPSAFWPFFISKQRDEHGPGGDPCHVALKCTVIAGIILNEICSMNQSFNITLQS